MFSNVNEVIVSIGCLDSGNNSYV